jgi:transcriptional regulator with GAF, ATPase, and Fis domain
MGGEGGGKVLIMTTESYFFPNIEKLSPGCAKKYNIAAIKGENESWGISPSMCRLKSDLNVALKTNVNVLVIGETGTGKEWLADIFYKRYLKHHQYTKVEAPFVAVNCAAIPENLFESLLFGHERGAFTSARERQVGKFESAKKGILFLDEIQTLSLNLQAKLLRVLQTREVDRLGSRESAQIQCQIVAATNFPLELLVESQKFRKDLYYRLNICPLYLPSLRHRKEDMPFIIETLQERIREKFNIAKKEISSEAYEALVNYSWPGNVRELEHCILYASLRAQKTIEYSHLIPRITGELLHYLKNGMWDQTMELA